jgi:hypothetical protein
LSARAGTAKAEGSPLPNPGFHRSYVETFARSFFKSC